MEIDLTALLLGVAAGLSVGRYLREWVADFLAEIDSYTNP